MSARRLWALAVVAGIVVFVVGVVLDVAHASSGNSDAQATAPGGVMVIVGLVLTIVAALALRFYYLREDQVRAPKSASEPHQPDGEIPGWYDDPEVPGVRRYWDGNAWTDSRVTTEGIPYNVPTTRRPVRPTSLILSAALIIGGAFCLWFAETYKPSAANALGLNGNTFVLKPGAYHAIVIGSIVLLVLGGIRLLTALSR